MIFLADIAHAPNYYRELVCRVFLFFFPSLAPFLILYERLFESESRDSCADLFRTRIYHAPRSFDTI